MIGRTCILCEQDERIFGCSYIEFHGVHLTYRCGILARIPNEYAAFVGGHLIFISTG
jgi:hypothetical protein